MGAAYRLCWTPDTCLTQSVGKLPQLFVRAFIHPADLIYFFPSC